MIGQVVSLKCCSTCLACSRFRYNLQHCIILQDTPEITSEHWPKYPYVLFNMASNYKAKQKQTLSYRQKTIEIGQWNSIGRLDIHLHKHIDWSLTKQRSLSTKSTKASR